MIILPNQKIGFISITKCASTTIEAALKQHKGVITGGTAGLKHMRFKHVDEFILPMLKTYRIERPHFFAVVRHPAARLLSWYNFRTRDDLAKARDGSKKAARYVGAMSLEEFIEQELASKSVSPTARIQSQLSYVTDKKGNIGVDTLIKIEAVDAILPDFLRHFRIQMDNVPVRKNVSPTTATGGMAEDLVKKIISSDRFGPDLELYHKGVDALPSDLHITAPQLKSRQRNKASDDTEE